MKIFIQLLLLCLAGNAMAQHKLVKLWESDTTLAIPESVLFDKNTLYVSLIDGAPWDQDGKGGIAKLSPDGKIINASWATGLNAPKGMGVWNKKLYVADLQGVAVINTENGKVESTIPVEGAQGLNDVTIDDKGTIYVSDSKLGQVYKVTNGKSELYMSDVKGINGLKAVGKDLYILSGAGVGKAGADKVIQPIAPTEAGGDGIEPVGNGDYIISCWGGIIYYLSKDGKMEILQDTRDQKRNSADIGFDPAKKIVYVPTFFKKSVEAYSLK